MKKIKISSLRDRVILKRPIKDEQNKWEILGEFWVHIMKNKTERDSYEDLQYMDHRYTIIMRENHLLDNSIVIIHQDKRLKINSITSDSTCFINILAEECYDQ